MKPGDMIGYYRVLGKLGHGGMGVVYKALDTRLDRLVALKVVDTESVSASGRIRFGREAKAASALGNLGDAYRWAPGTKQRAKSGYARAVQNARAELKAKPGNYEIHSRLAVYLAKLGDSGAARGELAEALRAGYAIVAIENEPELVSLRADRRYHVLMASRPAPEAAK